MQKTTSTTLTSWALLVWNTLLAKGYDAHTVFKNVGLDASKLGDGNARYPLSGMTKLWEAAIEETNDPCFGVEAGMRWSTTTFHALGFSWLASSTFREALQRFVRYTRIVNNSLNARLEEQGTNLCLITSTSEDEKSIHYAGRDAAMVSVITMCRMLCGENFSPLEIYVTRERSPCGDRLEKFAGVPINFNSERNMAVFEQMESERRLASGNSELARVNDDVAMKYLRSLDNTSIAISIRSKLIEMLPNGMVTEGMLAGQLNMSIRTLQRRIKEEGLSFSDVYKTTRQEIAKEYIQDSQMSITEISYLLGFADQANFTRAFRRWYGSSPSSYRKSLYDKAL